MTEDKDTNGQQDTVKAPDNTTAKKGNGDKKNHRRKLFAIFGGVLILIVIGYLIWLIFFAGKSVSTDNAYTAAEVADVTPLVGGPVKKVNVVNTQLVHAGDVLVVLDDTDARIAVSQAEAELGSARRKVM